VRALFVVLMAGVSAVAHADRVAQNTSCEGCHPDEAREWQSSLHRRAWQDDVFQKAYAVEPIAFCRGCHAPESDAAKEPTAAAQRVGVGCTTCHVDDRGVHATRAVRADHDVVVDATLSTPAACARCHEFDFPAGAHQRTPQPMQDTMAEHARSSEAKTPCQACHMPLVDGQDGQHHSHAFAVLADPRLIRDAVTVTTTRRDEGGHTILAVTLRAAKVGHAFPTGDMFRRIEVRARAGTFAAKPVVLGRSFTDVPRDPAGHDLTFMRVQSGDTRVPPPGGGERTVELQLPKGAPIAWSVVYQRMSTPMAEAFGVSQVLDEVTLAQGTSRTTLALHTEGRP